MPATIIRELSVAEAAARLGLARQTIHYLIAADKLTARRFPLPGGAWVWAISPASVEDYARRLATRDKPGPRPVAR